jgi:hypothetical protein
LVQEHLNAAHPLAAGLRVLPGDEDGFASIIGAWRFFQNAQVSLVQLAQPLLARARHAIATSCHEFVLLVHDWSQLHYNDHDDKAHRIPLSQSTDLGYELQAAVALSDQNGAPLAPVYQGLRAEDGVHSTLANDPQTPASQLDQLSPVMVATDRLAWSKPSVHIVDREADSIAHLRYWNRQGHCFLVRANDRGRAMFERRQRSLGAIADLLRRRRQFRLARDVEYRGRTVQQWVAETRVTITRAAKLQRQGKDGPRWKVPGEPLTLRLTVVELRDSRGKVVSRWLLLSNVPDRVDAWTLALWYYWRWRIESYFKLLKGAGLELEAWQQKTPSVLAKRLLVAAMACVLIWQLAQSDHPDAANVRRLLVRLSGRQMKHGQPFTMPALLAGFWIYLQMVQATEDSTFAQLRDLVPSLSCGPYVPANTS